MILNNLLRHIRIKSKLTINSAAAAAGISASHLRSLETGRSQPSVASVMKLEKAYNIPHGGLLDALNSKEMCRIYVSSAEQDRKKVSEICRDIQMNNKDILIFSPALVFEFMSCSTIKRKTSNNEKLY